MTLRLSNLFHNRSERTSPSSPVKVRRAGDVGRGGEPSYPAKKEKGSITLEAALSLSLFLFAVTGMIWLFEVMSIQTNLRNALYSAGRQLAKEAYVNPLISPSQVRTKVVENIGEDRLNKSVIKGGASGLDFKASKRYGSTTVMDLNVAYEIKLPIPVFDIPLLSRSVSVKVKGWTGYESYFAGATAETTVYMTKNGLVYHADPNCSYLDLSIRPVAEKDIGSLRNLNGAKYKKCERCGKGVSSGVVYVTDYGTKYHTSLNCSGLKRSVYAIPLSDVNGLSGCSKCVK